MSSPAPVDNPQVTVANVFREALLKGRRGWLLLASTFGFVTHQISEAAVPVLIGIVIDQAVVHQNAASLLLWLSILGAVFVLLSISYQRASLGMVSIFGLGEHAIRQRALHRVLHPRGGATHRGTGQVLSVTTSDADRVAGISWSIAEQTSTIAALLLASSYLLWISVPLGVGVLIGAIGVLVGMHALARPLERLGLAEQTSVAAASHVATDAMSGLRVIRGLGAHAEVERRYKKASQASFTGAVVAARRMLTYETVSSIVSVIYLGALAYAAAWMGLRGDITVGQLVTVVALAQFLQGLLAHIGTFGANWAHKRASARRMQALLNTEYALAPGSTAHLSATTPTPLVWDRGGVVIQASVNQLVGIKVDSAAQARTISDALGLRRQPDVGEIYVHGVKASTLNPALYRKLVFAPPQNAALFSGTLRENILGFATSTQADLPAWSDELIEASALSDVVRLLGTPDAALGENGKRLSGGQRQRVLLARALHHGAEILVLNEPTTALDPLTEHRVATGLRSLNRTIVVVTSRPILLNACHTVIDSTPVEAYS